MNRDDFYDDGVVTTERQEQLPPVVERQRRSIDEPIDPITTSVTPPSPPPIHAAPMETIDEEIKMTKSHSSSASNDSSSSEDERPRRTTANVDIQTDPPIVRDESIQTETTIDETPPKVTARKIAIIQDSDKQVVPSSALEVATSKSEPLVKTLFDQTISSILPIISFCQPMSMTSRGNDVILTMPRHLMIINNQNSVSVYPWQQHGQSATILECVWCPFLYKLLVTTVEENRLFIYDFISIIDSITLRGHPLSVKHKSQQSKKSTLSLLPSSSRHQDLTSFSSLTRFTKSNSIGIFYCYITDRQQSCMLTRIDHNTRRHIKAIDCSGGNGNDGTRVCATGLSEDRVAVVLTNLVMTLYDAETLLGIRQINLARWKGYDGIRGVSAIVHLWKTWIVLDSTDNKIVGIGKQKRQFTKMLPEQPINACVLENGTVALWLGYPGAVLYYRLSEV